jgi:hypothetical protein
MKRSANEAAVAKRESRFSTLASEEAINNEKAESKAKGANKKDLKWEVGEDKKFASIRKKRANKAKERE